MATPAPTAPRIAPAPAPCPVFTPRILAEMDKCIQCGACRHVCPVFSVDRLEKAVARGKLALCLAVADGALPLGDGVRATWDNCLLCMACVENCSAGVQLHRIVTAARAAAARDLGLAPAKRLVYGHVLAKAKVLHRLMKTGALLQYLLFRRIPHTSGLRRRLALPLVDAQRLVPPLAWRPFRHRTAPWVPAAGSRETVLFFTGCATHFIYPQIGEAVVGVLHRLGVNVAIPAGQGCCGAPVEAGGDRDTFEQLARGTIDQILEADPEAPVLVCCASCGFMLKHGYRHLFAADPLWGPRAEAVAARTWDISQYLAEHIGLERVASLLQPGAPLSVTYHDPCHLNRGQAIRTAPRQLLGLVCSDGFVEMAEAGRCCGSGGSYGLTHPLTSAAIMARKIGHVADSRATTVATGCPACIMQLRDGLARQGVAGEVRHTVEILAERMGVIGPGASGAAGRGPKE